MDDGAYGYTGPHQQFKMPGATAFVLNLTSQTWLTDDDFKPYSPVKSTWWHQLTVIVPDKLDKDLTTSFIWVTGGSNTNHSQQVDPKDSELGVVGAVAVATGRIATQVPTFPRLFLLKMQKEWRVSPENDDFLLKIRRFICNSRYYWCSPESDP